MVDQLSICLTMMSNRDEQQKEKKENVTIDKSANQNTLQEWVTLAIKLIDWSYYDFEVTVILDTKLSEVLEILRNHHGAKMDEVVVYKSEIRQSMELNDTEKSLKEYGFVGSAIKEDAPVISLYYNFKPAKHRDISDPILLSWK